MARLIDVVIPVCMCFRCRHYAGYIEDRYTCAAFPDGVPDVILMSDHDHRQPYEGDNGIRFEPIEDSDE